MSIASLLLVLFAAAPSPDAASEPLLLDFHAQWCGPCRQMRQTMSLLAERGYPIKSIDIDHEPELSEKYGVRSVPTYIVVDADGSELGRTSGSQPVGQLARFYLDARAKAQPPANSRAHADAHADDEADGDAEPPEARGKGTDGDVPPFQNPKPWETVVRIRVLARGSVGFGSGTVIHSSPGESLILTCAHIFKLEGQRQAPPQRFPRKIMVDLFDGKLHGDHPAQVHYVESLEGQAVDYDFNVDVGLIRIRPGRRLAAARVVPAHWQARAKMLMMTVGCSEGQDATAWETVVQNPQMHGLSGNPAYQAIECRIAPKQGRSGGGLFTTDGYIAGVCNFAEPQGDHGLYATPRSIYSVLDRNKLTALYGPVEGGQGTSVAARGDHAVGRGDVPITVARGQSPEGREGERARNRPSDVTIPAPELLGIKPPVARRTSGRSTGDGSGEGSTRRMAWQAAHSSSTTPAKPAAGEEEAARTEQTNLSLDAAADHDHFSHFEDNQAGTDPSANKQSSSEKSINAEDVPASASPAASPAPKSRWRPAQSAQGNPISDAPQQ
jgi:thiol-disulfide isomerase/thioredoxin